MSAANGGGRKCADCGYPLSMYNPDDRCQSCLRSGMPVKRPDGQRRRRVPDYLPAEILARSDFRDACTRHDFGAMFLIIHEYKDDGWTFIHIGRRCEISNIRNYTNGNTQPLSVHVIERVCDGLHIPGDMMRISRRPWETETDSAAPPYELFTEPQETIDAQDQEHSPAIAELSAMLTDYGFGLDRFSSAQNEDVPSLAELKRDIRIAFTAYQQSRFASAASRISMLLADAQLAVQSCKKTERERIQGILALSYQAAASVLTKSGEPDLAWIAAERGFHAAESSSNPAIRGSLIRSLAFALHSTSRFEPAIRLVDANVDSLYGEIAGSDAMLSVYGTLILVGSMAAARFGDGSRTAEYLREANNAARRLGRDANHLWTSFGPSNVAIHRVNTAVELGDFQTALDSAPSLTLSAVSTERRVRYMLDIARVHALTGQGDDALGTLLTAERIAPEQIRQHYLSRRVVTTLIKNTIGKPSTELSKLATRVKVGNPNLCKIPQLVSQRHGLHPGHFSLIVTEFS